MKTKAGWKLRIARIKADIAREVKQDYLAGSTIPEIMVKYGLTKKTVYKWIVPTKEEQDNHLNQVMAQNKMGPPLKNKRKRSIKIKEVANTNY